MLRKVRIFVIAVAWGACVSGALSDVPAGEKKAAPCVHCHSPDNSHGAPQLDAQPAGYLLRKFDLYKSGVRFGPIMQAQLNALTTKELRDLAEYFSSRPATRASTKFAVENREVQQGQKIADDLQCAECHGKDYRGTQDVPRLAAQRLNYLAFTIERLQRDGSLHPPMEPAGQLIPQSSVEALASYLASLPP